MQQQIGVSSKATLTKDGLGDKGQPLIKKVYKKPAMMYKEVEIMEILDHTNVMTLYDYNLEQGWIRMELMAKDLFDVVASRQQLFTDNTCKQLTLQILRGVEHLHSSGVAHRDIKLENMLLSDDLTVIITDFDLAQLITQDQLVVREIGTQNYIAPELISSMNPVVQTNQLKKADIFSLGVALFMIFYKHPPFSCAKSRCPYWKLIAVGDWTTYWNIINKKRLQQHQQPPNVEVQNLLMKLLDPNPNNRPSVTEILGDEYYVTAKINMEQYDNEMAEYLN